MKRILTILFHLLALTTMAQTKGRFEVHKSVISNCIYITPTMH